MMIRTSGLEVRPRDTGWDWRNSKGHILSSHFSCSMYSKPLNVTGQEGHAIKLHSLILEIVRRVLAS
jgi:hypothetical protein